MCVIAGTFSNLPEAHFFSAQAIMTVWLPLGIDRSGSLDHRSTSNDTALANQRPVFDESRTFLTQVVRSLHFFPQPNSDEKIDTKRKELPSSSDVASVDFEKDFFARVSWKNNVASLLLVRD